MKLRMKRIIARATVRDKEKRRVKRKQVALVPIPLVHLAIFPHQMTMMMMMKKVTRIET